MQNSRRFRWTSPNAVVAIATAAALVVLGASGALLIYADRAVDRTMAEREQQLMAHALNHRLNEMLEDVTPSSVWSDAYHKVAHALDRKFLHSNYGDNYQRFRNHNITVVFDGQDRPVYTGAELQPVDAKSIAPFIEAVGPLLARLREDEAKRLVEAPGAMGLDRRVGLSAGVRVGREVFLVGASTIVPEADYAGVVKPGPGPAVVSAMTVDARVMEELDRESGLKDATLVLDPPSWNGMTPIRDVNGDAVAGLVSTPPRLVQGVFQGARWQIAVLGGLMAAIVGFLIYSLRRLARSVEQARERAEAGDFAKSEFIANMSHEIRTPLNGVLGMAQVMEADELSESQRERLKVIRESGATLLALLNDVLDLSKIEAGKLELSPATFDLEELVRRVGATFAGVASAKDLALEVSVDPAAKGLWRGDALRIRQVLANLVSNAVKFTDTGRVILSATLMEEGLCFDVIDTGIGIDAGKAPQLFDKFAQADASTTRRYGGTGLGLSIVTALLELMGGFITVDSRPGAGSRFTVVLPLPRVAGEAPAPAEEAAPQAAAPMERAVRVLAAEDNPTNQAVLRALLAPLGVDVTMVANGREAVEAFAAEPFDVVLMDVQMPEMNGVDATRAIRAMEAAEGRAATPILALTANVMSHQLESYLAAGMDGHIAKPLDVASLYGAIEGALAGSADAAAAA